MSSCQRAFLHPEMFLSGNMIGLNGHALYIKIFLVGYPFLLSQSKEVTLKMFFVFESSVMNKITRAWPCRKPVVGDTTNLMCIHIMLREREWDRFHQQEPWLSWFSCWLNRIVTFSRFESCRSNIFFNLGAATALFAAVLHLITICNAYRTLKIN